VLTIAGLSIHSPSLVRSIHPWQVSGVQTTLWEASTRLRFEDQLKVNSFVVHGSFEQYVANACRATKVQRNSEAVVLPMSWDGALKASGLRESKKGESEPGSLVRARMWLASAFPLTARHFLLVLDVIAVVSSSARKLQKALKGWQWSDAFPMKLHVPLMLTVWAQVSCTAFKPLDAASLPDDWFGVPDEYELSSTFGGPLEASGVGWPLSGVW